MTVEEAAVKLGGCSIWQIYKLMKTGRLAFIQVGRRRFPTNESVEKFIQENLQPETPVEQQPKPATKKGKKEKGYKIVDW